MSILEDTSSVDPNDPDFEYLSKKISASPNLALSLNLAQTEVLEAVKKNYNVLVHGGVMLN
jgi:hypothetical protein